MEWQLQENMPWLNKSAQNYAFLRPVRYASCTVTRASFPGFIRIRDLPLLASVAQVRVLPLACHTEPLYEPL